MSTSNVILLSHDFQFLNIVSIKKAVKLVVKKRVEVVKSSEKQLHSGFYLPTVIRLLKAIDATFNKKLPYSKEAVFIRDGYKCQYCGKSLNRKQSTIDHVIPVSKGGKTNFTNCVTACKTCNSWKGNQMLHQTNMQLEKTPTHPTFSEYLFYKMKSMGIDLKEIWK